MFVYSTIGRFNPQEMSTMTATKPAPKIAKSQPAKRGMRGMLAVIQRYHSSTMLHGATVVSYTYAPCKVSSVSRDGEVKTVLVWASHGRVEVRAREWTRIAVDLRGKVALDKVEALLATLPRSFESMEAAAEAIHDATGLLRDYRYRGDYGSIKIHAKDDDDALLQAAMSIDGEPTRDRLEVYRPLTGTFVLVDAP